MEDFIMTHSELWDGIKNLAECFNISCSRLAQISGLDPTTFNPTKRITKYGQDRWLTTYTLARVLDATGLTLSQFAQYMPSDTHIYPKSPYITIKPKKLKKPQNTINSKQI